VAYGNTQGLFHTEIDVFRQLLIADSLRGVDGTGIVKVSKTGFPTWIKLDNDPYALLSTIVSKKKAKDGDKWLSDASSECARILIGHNRAASVGLRDTTSAHPFEHKHITLVHNGRIGNYRDFPIDKDTTVDSDGLTQIIANVGIDNAIADIRGAYAIVYWNAEEKTLNFIRNTERPLAYFYEPTQKRLFWASEWGMLWWILIRNGVQNPKIESLPVNELMTFNLDIEEPTFRKVEPIYGSCSFPAKAPEPDENGVVDPLWNVSRFDTEWVIGENNKWIRQKKPVKTYYPPTPTNSLSYPVPTTGAYSNVANIQAHKNKRISYPSILMGYKKDDPIEFWACDKEKSSLHQEQFRVIGQHQDHNKLTIICYVKGEVAADELIAAGLLRATVRSLERDIPSGEAIIHVSGAEPIPDPTILQEEHKQSLLH
jgi:hypothetical protein